MIRLTWYMVRALSGEFGPHVTRYLASGMYPHVWYGTSVFPSAETAEGSSDE